MLLLKQKVQITPMEVVCQRSTKDCVYLKPERNEIERLLWDQVEEKMGLNLIRWDFSIYHTWMGNVNDT